MNEAKNTGPGISGKAFVYMLECGDGSFYTGWTTDIEDRVRTHNSGQGAKYTRSRLPVKLVYFEEAKDRSAALKREAAIKRLTREKKELLIAGRLPHTDNRKPDSGK